jgi:two-component system, OmpR family, response regulator
MERPKHILVVDDNGDVRDVIAAMLEEIGHRVSLVEGGAMMRDFLKNADSADAVVLDSLMPGEASASLALHVKDLHLPLVMISGSHDAMLFAEEHGLQLLRKPFRSHELVDAIDMAIASRKFGQRDA